MNEHIYKVGDIVTIRRDLDASQIYDKMDVNYEMIQFAGKHFRIESRLSQIKNTIAWRLKEMNEDENIDSDVSYWKWTNDMFEKQLKDMYLRKEEN